MNRNHALVLVASFVALEAPIVAPPPAPAINVGSTGADGVLDVPASTSMVIDLATQGTYDPVNWRVVFHYQSVTIGAGATVTFLNHPSRAPVVWLSQGDIVIEGTVSLGGQTGTVPPTQGYAEPGPGGFRGGAGMPVGATSVLNSGGFGPGGGGVGVNTGGGGGHAAAGGHGQSPQTNGGDPYGDAAITWLVGGSGGGGGRTDGTYHGCGGGAGGGAILIASNTKIHVRSGASIGANGGRGGSPGFFYYGGGGGSGGSIRLLADEIQVDNGAVVKAEGGVGPGGTGGTAGTGSSGYVCYEANTFTLNNQSSPPASVGSVGTVLPAATAPRAWIHTIGGQPVPADPRASVGLGTATADVVLPGGVGTPIVIRTTNVPLNAQVFLYETRAAGVKKRYEVADGVNTLLQVTGGASMEAEVSATVNLANKGTALQVRVVLP